MFRKFSLITKVLTETLALRVGKEEKQARCSLVEAAHTKKGDIYHNERKFMTSPHQLTTYNHLAATSLRKPPVYIPMLSNLFSIMP